VQPTFGFALWRLTEANQQQEFCCSFYSIFGLTNKNARHKRKAGTRYRQVYGGTV